jgi:hypothetical protein
MDNKDNSITLSKNKEIELMEGVKIKTADQDVVDDANPLRYYIYKEVTIEGAAAEEPVAAEEPAAEEPAAEELHGTSSIKEIDAINRAIKDQLRKGILTLNVSKEMEFGKRYTAEVDISINKSVEDWTNDSVSKEINVSIYKMNVCLTGEPDKFTIGPKNCYDQVFGSDLTRKWFWDVTPIAEKSGEYILSARATAIILVPGRANEEYALDPVTQTIAVKVSTGPTKQDIQWIISILVALLSSSGAFWIFYNWYKKRR